MKKWKKIYFKLHMGSQGIPESKKKKNIEKEQNWKFTPLYFKPYWIFTEHSIQKKQNTYSFQVHMEHSPG